MYSEIENRFKLVRKQFEDSENDLKILDRAFNLANELHSKQVRKDGTPYISHPVEAAIILAELGFDVDVVCAALLHDIVEDCGFTIEDIKRNFSSNIAQMVDCVSAIDKANYKYNEDNIFESEAFVKASAEEQTFKKLVSIGKKNPKGFAVKFADRLHNLKTIGTFPYNKQLEKVKETEKWILPIAKVLNAEYFYFAIKNECFKITNRNKAANFLKQCEFYERVNKANTENVASLLREVFSSKLVKDIYVEKILESEIYLSLCEALGNIKIEKISQGQILNVSNYNIYLFTEKNLTNSFGNVFDIINQKLQGQIKIIDAKVNGFTNKIYYQLEDRKKNKYNLYVMTKSDYFLQKLGTLDGLNDKLDEENINDLENDYMKVKTRSGEVKYVPKNSTVLDFAFKLHRDIGFGFKYAIINNSKTQQPPYTKLKENDKIEIFFERDENNQIINNTELKWFAYVNTELAKKMLIKWFEKKIDE